MEERAEYDELLDEVCAKNDTTGTRAAALIDGLDDAVQAHRPWALPVLKDLAYVGAQRAVKRHARRRAPSAITKSGRDKVVMAGRKVTTETGGSAYQQEQLTLFTREDLQAMATRAGQQIKAERDNIEWAKALLALMDKHPSAATVADALRAEGTTIEAWLEASAS